MLERRLTHVTNIFPSVFPFGKRESMGEYHATMIILFIFVGLAMYFFFSFLGQLYKHDCVVWKENIESGYLDEGIHFIIY